MDTRRIVEISRLITEDPDLFNSDINRELEMNTNMDTENDKKDDIRREQEQEREQEELDREKQEKIIKPQLDKINQSFGDISQEAEQSDNSLQDLDGELNRLSLLLKRFEGSF